MLTGCELQPWEQRRSSSIAACDCPNSLFASQISKTVISGRQLKRIGTGNQPMPALT